jgi:hypothetical protein
MDLIASWNKPEDEYYEAPDAVKWANGSQATLADYERHIDDTKCWIEDGIKGRVLLLCPDVVAVVSYDPYGGVWAVTGDGVEPRGLDLCDPNASDSQINCALNSGVWTYRMIIHRN